MPGMVTKTSGAIAYGKPFIDGPRDVLHVKVDVSALTTAEVDIDGYLKAGVPLAIDGLLIGASNTKRVGVTPNEVKIADTNTGLAGITADPFVAVAFSGTVNRDSMEDNLGRALTANEIAGLNGVGSSIKLSLT
ncbi:MAG TPA: hypothetical protein VGD05_14085 [Pyrinomonadaceae bacterium]